MAYLHVEIEIQQQAKHPDQPCGDVVLWERDPSATILVLADGIGSGVVANIAANFAVHRLLQLMRDGLSPQAAFQNVVKSMHAAKSTQGLYAALSLCRVLNDGQALVQAYEMPAPILVENQGVCVLPQRKIICGGEVVAETRLTLRPGQRLLLMSDGITQAGMGRGVPGGWQEKGVASFLNQSLHSRLPEPAGSRAVLRQAWTLDKQQYHDDMSVAQVSTRPGQVVNIFSGPPKNSDQDQGVIRRFLEQSGIRVVCGATTAQLVSRHLGHELKMEKNIIGFVEPPKYQLPGIDLVTEGAITLNQVYRILDEPADAFNQRPGGVAGLASLLHFADRVNFLLGSAANPAHQDIRFTQMGILPRTSLVPLLAEKLKKLGKLAVVEEV